MIEDTKKEMTAAEKRAAERKAREERVRILREKRAHEKANAEIRKLEKTPYDYVKGARSKDRLTSLDFIKGLFPEFIELHGDRRFADDPAVIGGVGYLDDIPFTVLATEKGRDTKSRIKRNFGTPNPEGYRKSLRLMKQAEKFKRPIVCFVDTAGAFCGIGAEERGQGQAIAENIMELMTLKTPVLSILIGEGGSGGALALAVADEVWMFENAVYSVISPEGCANILWRDPEKAAQAAQSLKLTSKDISALGIVEQVIPEKSKDPEKMLHDLKAQILKWYATISTLTPDELKQKRYERFRKIGV
ncbi:MAG: acetyl-CoA carboxylase carboxyltransferase subunit alpha [Oscillospiraceae bacterium]|nr:acetyl-CoA carboxylase carboxyltransferase subunit alpha [Oscillospiraceae bacterium]